MKKIKLIPLKEKEEQKLVDKLLHPYDYGTYSCQIPKCCEHCSNHPKNGGSGICNCTLPYLYNYGY